MRKYSNRLIDEFERATRCEAWAGAQPKEERAGIHAEFKLAKQNLEIKIRDLQEEVYAHDRKTRKGRSET